MVTVLLCSLMCCLPPDWAMLRQALMEYERTHIHPVWQRQQARLHKQLVGKERSQLEKLQDDYTQTQKDLRAWEQKPSLPADRDKILRRITEIRTALLPIQEKYAKLLATFAQERAALKPQWRADMQAIIDQYNAQIDDNSAPYFAKYNFGAYDDDDAFLLWKSEKEPESAAGDRED